jgi:threonine/homoserine/homoserine lactone efflux protein
VTLGTAVLTFAVLAGALTVTPGLDTALVLARR